MTNNLKNFLEEETQLFENRYKDISTQIKSYGEYCDVRDFNTQSNKRIVNKVLDLVEKEVDKILECSCNDCFDEKAELRLSINNLRV